MPYQLQQLSPPQIARLDEVTIDRQEQIITQTGAPLLLTTTYYLLKNASADFTLDHPTAKQLDAALYSLLEKKGFFGAPSATPVTAVQRVRIAMAKAKAQAARIRILQLKEASAA